MWAIFTDASCVLNRTTTMSAVVNVEPLAFQVFSENGSMFANNALLVGGVRVRVRVWIREQRKIKRRSKALLSL